VPPSDWTVTTRFYAATHKVAIQKANDGTYVYVDETVTAEHYLQPNEELKRIREAMTDRLDTLKSRAAGKELDLQMASQEYSRSSQLASNLLNTRNEALKVFAQALSRA
jgi:hypothetical protein